MLENEATPKGFLVYRKGRFAKAPKFIHPTFGAAMTEAQRLAKQHVGCAFYVVELVGLVGFNETNNEYIYR